MRIKIREDILKTAAFINLNIWCVFKNMFVAKNLGFCQRVRIPLTVWAESVYWSAVLFSSWLLNNMVSYDGLHTDNWSFWLVQISSNALKRSYQVLVPYDFSVQDSLFAFPALFLNCTCNNLYPWQLVTILGDVQNIIIYHLSKRNCFEDFILFNSI